MHNHAIGQKVVTKTDTKSLKTYIANHHRLGEEEEEITIAYG